MNIPRADFHVQPHFASDGERFVEYGNAAF